jgi:ATP/maltotriose-dependent transcriptional regulator MalT
MPMTSEGLLERDKELAQLAALLEDVRAGHGRVGLVYGEAGIGKTAFLKRFVSEHVTPPMRLFWGGCDALFTPRPLAPLQEVAWLHGGRLAEKLRDGASRDTIFQIFFEELVRPHPPAVVVMEDVHWADEATLDLLKFLGRRADRTCALLVISWRDDEVPAAHPLRSMLGDLSRAAVRRIPLQALSPRAVEQLAREANGRAGNLHALTGGNPFFVTEVLAGGEAAVPATVSDAVLSRASRLSAPARELLDLASVAPTRIELPTLEAAAGSAFAALDELLAAGMLSLGDGAVSFRHELARRAIEDAVPPLRARDLHARLLAALRSLPEKPGLLDRLVHHAERAGDVALVLMLAPDAAAHAALLGAHREAAAHLATALRHAPQLEPGRRAELLESRAYQCYLTDRMKEAIEACTAALELWHALGDTRREGDCLRWLSRMCWYSARTQDAQRYGAMAVDTLETLQPGFELAMAWSTRSQLHMCAGEASEARVWGEKALALARDRGFVEPEVHALNNLGCARIQVGDEEGWELLEESLRISIAHGFQEHSARALSNLGSFAVEERRHQSAARWLREGIEFASDRDLGTIRLCSLVWQARLRVVVGEWSEAAEEAALAIDDPGASQVTRLVALTALGLVRARRGDAGAWAALDDALVLARQSGEAQWLVPVAAARAELAWLEGDAPRARAEVADALELAVRLDRAWYIGELAVWMWRGGGQPPATRMARPFALQLVGDWRAAADELERIGCRYDAALAAFEGDDRDALLRALAVLDGLEAKPAAARLRRRLSELGVRGVPRGPLSARRGHPFDLTAREQEVLDALALGLSNAQIGERLFVSRKTIDHHVSSILSKLGVPSRGIAVAKARHHGLLEARVSGAGQK